MRRILACLDLLDAISPKHADRATKFLERTAQNYISAPQTAPSVPVSGDPNSLMTRLDALQRAIAVQVQEAMQIVTTMRQTQQNTPHQQNGIQQAAPGVQPAPAMSQPGITLPLGTNNLNVWDGSKINMHTLGQGNINFTPQS